MEGEGREGEDQELKRERRREQGLDRGNPGNPPPSPHHHLDTQHAGKFIIFLFSRDLTVEEQRMIPK